jgi:hypothetical protein
MKKLLLISAVAASFSVFGSAAAYANGFPFEQLIQEILGDFREFKRDAARPAPGPVAGVGLPFLLAAGFYAWRRRQQVRSTTSTQAENRS